MYEITRLSVSYKRIINAEYETDAALDVLTGPAKSSALPHQRHIETDTRIT